MKSYIEQLKDYGVKAVTFSGGGEPLMNRDTETAIVHARAIGLDVGLITNGQYMAPGGLADVIVGHCTWVRVSLSATTPKAPKGSEGQP